MAENIKSLKARGEKLMDKYNSFNGSLSFMNPLSKYRIQAEQPKFEMEARTLYREFQSINEGILTPDERKDYADLESVMQDLLETIFE